MTIDGNLTGKSATAPVSEDELIEAALRQESGPRGVEPVVPPLPKSIGPYKIIRRIGAGGMGVVYEAEQSEPTRRVALSVTIRTPGGAFSPPEVRAVTGPCQTATRQLSVGGGFEGNATLAKVGGASWLTIPATCENEVPFAVEVDASELSPAGNFAETIRASADGYDDADCVVSVAVRSEGPKP